jgi:hypothetical protein
MGLTRYQQVCEDRAWCGWTRLQTKENHQDKASITRGWANRDGLGQHRAMQKTAVRWGCSLLLCQPLLSSLLPFPSPHASAYTHRSRSGATRSAEQAPGGLGASWAPTSPALWWCTPS